MQARDEVKWDTVAIIGVGLIGGSIGLALQHRKLARHIVGIGRRVSSLQRAKSLGVVTSTTTNLPEGVAEAQLVVVCTPVADIVRHATEAARACQAGTLITDVGSSKQRIVDQMAKSGDQRAYFVGSHPLAGSDKAGARNAQTDLLEGRAVVMTPTDETNWEAAERIEGFWTSLGARVIRMTPSEHDLALAMTSHAPHVIASALALATPQADLPLTATGWADTTRIASSNPELWWQILSSNQSAVLQAIDKFEKVLAQFRTALKDNDRIRMIELLESGKQTRDALGS